MTSGRVSTQQRWLAIGAVLLFIAPTSMRAESPSPEKAKVPLRLIVTTYKRPVVPKEKIKVEFLLTNTSDGVVKGCVGPKVRVLVHRNEEVVGSVESVIGGGNCFPSLYFVLKPGQTMKWDEDVKLSMPLDAGQHGLSGEVLIKEPDRFKGENRQPSWTVSSEAVAITVEI